MSSITDLMTGVILPRRPASDLLSQISQRSIGSLSSELNPSMALPSVIHTLTDALLPMMTPSPKFLRKFKTPALSSLESLLSLKSCLLLLSKLEVLCVLHA
jgi:hypothetical protein